KSMPRAIRDRLQDLDANLKEPRVLGNNILQGRFNAAAITIGRIIFNTTFGLGGLFDVASQGGLPHQSGDFGQTLFVWGVPSGSYTVTPHFGQWKQAESSSVDFYSFLRSSFYQTRRAQLREALGLPPQIESPATPGPVVGSPAPLRPAGGSGAYTIPPPQ